MALLVSMCIASIDVTRRLVKSMCLKRCLSLFLKELLEK